nr:monovalent cation/H+ antiporter complex subunit F [Dietzia sp. E1]
MVSVALVLWILAIIALTAAMFTTMIRLVGGPGTLDRLISLDTLVAVAQGGIGVYIAWTKDTTPAAALVALALVAFLGSVSVARFRVRDNVGTPEEAIT